MKSKNNLQVLPGDPCFSGYQKVTWKFCWLTSLEGFSFCCSKFPVVFSCSVKSLNLLRNSNGVRNKLSLWTPTVHPCHQPRILGIFLAKFKEIGNQYPLEFNIAPENLASQLESNLPATHFSGAKLLNFGGCNQPGIFLEMGGNFPSFQQPGPGFQVIYMVFSSTHE